MKAARSGAVSRNPASTGAAARVLGPWTNVGGQCRLARASDNNHEESDNNHEADEERLEGRKRRRVALSTDRCENQGAPVLAGRDARSGPNAHQAGRPRSGRGVEVERGSGVVARRNDLHR